MFSGIEFRGICWALLMRPRATSSGSRTSRNWVLGFFSRSSSACVTDIVAFIVTS